MFIAASLIEREKNWIGSDVPVEASHNVQAVSGLILTLRAFLKVNVSVVIVCFVGSSLQHS